MSTEKQVVSWGAVATALITILVAKPEFFRDLIIEHAGVLVPMVAAAVLALGVPYRFKHLLPSAKWIPALSVVVCIFTYMTFRAAWLMKFGGEYTWNDVWIDLIIASVEATLIPILYDYLPENVRKRWSYTTMKRVRTASGEIVMRPKDHPSGDGEKTVIDK